MGRAISMDIILISRGIPGLGKIQGFGRHLDTDAGPSMPASESIENPDRAGLRYPDGIEDHPKYVLIRH